MELGPWDSHAAILRSLQAAIASRGQATSSEPGPTLLDGTRAMELSEAVVRSLRRGRTIDLHYEAISEEASFKSIMTSTGCVLLLAERIWLSRSSRLAKARVERRRARKSSSTERP